MINKESFDDSMDILSQAHNWRLSEAALTAFYGQVKASGQDDFDQAFRAALACTGYYTPAKFVGALRANIVERAKASNQRALPSAKYEPCPEGLMKLSKHMKHLKRLKANGHDWRSPEMQKLDVHLKKCFKEPLTDDEILAAEGKTVSDLLTDAFGASPNVIPDEEWGEEYAA